MNHFLKGLLFIGDLCLQFHHLVCIQETFIYLDAGIVIESAKYIKHNIVDVEYWSNPSNRQKSIYLNFMHFLGLSLTLMGPKRFFYLNILKITEIYILVKETVMTNAYRKSKKKNLKGIE